MSLKAQYTVKTFNVCTQYYLVFNVKWGTTVPKQNCIHREIKHRLNLGNAGYHSVQSSHFLSNKLQNYNFTCCFVCVCNLVSHTEGGREIEGYLIMGC